MADPALLGLIGTLSGTTLGFAGGLIAQLVLERQKQAAEKRKKKAEKLEELALALCAYMDWLFMIKERIRTGNETSDALLAQSPPMGISKMAAISAVYFPDFQDSGEEFAKITATYVAELERNKHLADDGFLQCVEAGRRLDDLIRAYGKREFQ